MDFRLVRVTFGVDDVEMIAPPLPEPRVPAAPLPAAPSAECGLPRPVRSLPVGALVRVIAGNSMWAGREAFVSWSEKDQVKLETGSAAAEVRLEIEAPCAARISQNGIMPR